MVDRGGKRIQQASGNLQFSRPGKFRWTYLAPYEQLIVGDGTKLWIFDKDLNQVTARKLDDALGASPAALLAGDNAIEKNFDLKNVAAKDGLEWLEATPKATRRRSSGYAWASRARTWIPWSSRTSSGSSP